MRRALAALAVLLVLWPGTAAGQQHPVPLLLPDQTAIKAAPDQTVLRVQYVLRSYGYTLAVDGLYGPQTARAVRHWQTANRIAGDGQITPETLQSLRLTSPAAVTAPAVRDNLPLGPSTPEQTIRDVWPDELEDHAVAIATRESRLVPTARNACCWGLFQIHWRAHRAWLAGLGITQPGQLLDAQTNASAALALYEMDGWTPWAL